ncbi:iron-containing redox enzyme family protein [Myxacorys almedinensis]|uniref:Iron-containing redox enzyme family protein n=1 Tax=Myxacorys almedinensis A TaxID=2690445 RepID=A0A8J7Z8J6_9CYAN|nr:iron-containing redox enzyme family protein [Myxacorys almedinensis]NDJ19901.1 iron-containing redox enzyme family protein [Myxacorys almedinensis A]
MQGSLVTPLKTQELLPATTQAQIKTNPYYEAEKSFGELIEIEDLDQQLNCCVAQINDFEAALERALAHAYKTTHHLADHNSDDAHWFIQRVLYRINRLNLFWYDDLHHYTNERSLYLQKIRNQIEAVWQQWELAQVDVESYTSLDFKQALSDRYEADLTPALSADALYLQNELSLEGYRYLIAIASFDGLIESSRLTRILGGAANEVQATLTKVLIEEYGNGRLSRKHSTFFALMMTELGLDTQPEAYIDLVPWQILASTNHNFLLTECKRHFLRYNGGLAYFEVAGPSAYRNYLAAAQRLGLSDDAMGYWELHIREDERHGRWMIENVTLPLIDMYPNEAWQLVLGYDQEKQMGDRASAAVVERLRQWETKPLPMVSP